MNKRTKEQISYNMSRIGCKGTEIEKRLGSALWAKGIRYRKNYNKIEGNPDFAIVKERIAVFCDSAFWHGYKNMTTKVHNFKKRKTFWRNKIQGNIQRDREVNKVLSKEGWQVIRFWDFNILKKTEKCAEKVEKIIKKS